MKIEKSAPLLSYPESATACIDVLDHEGGQGQGAFFDIHFYVCFWAMHPLL